VPAAGPAAAPAAGPAAVPAAAAPAAAPAGLTCSLQLWQQARQHQAVGCHGQRVQPRQAGQLLREGHDVAPHGGLPAGEPDLGDARLGKQAGLRGTGGKDVSACGAVVLAWCSVDAGIVAGSMLYACSQAASAKF
jgi:hypothetical protein